MPGQLLKPLSESERLYILTSLKNEIGRHFRMLNDDKLRITDFIQLITFTDQSCIISCLMEEKKFCCKVSEKSICSAIDGFIDRLEETDRLLDDQMAVEAIDRCIEKLKKSKRRG